LDTGIYLCLGPDITVELDSDSGGFIRSSGVNFYVPYMSRNMSIVFELLALEQYSGEEFDSLIRAKCNLQEASLVNYYLSELERGGLVRYSVFDKSSHIADVIPYRSTKFRLLRHSPNRAGYRTHFRLSKFTMCRREESYCIAESSLSNTEVLIHSPEVFFVLAQLSKPRTIDELQANCPRLDAVALRLLLDVFSILEIVDQTDANGNFREDTDPRLRLWECHDLYFHLQSRAGGSSRPIGAHYPFSGSIPAAPALEPFHSTDSFPLYKPDLNGLVANDVSLTEALESRNSIRSHGATPIAAQQLGEFLYRSARITELGPATSPNNQSHYQMSRRPYPSGGACYDLEIYITVTKCAGLEPGLFWYHPLEHSLHRVSGVTRYTEALIRDATLTSLSDSPPQLLFTFTSRTARLSWKYRRISYATTLKNVGVLIQTMYLVATAMRLAPCALGTGNSETFLKAAGLDRLTECPVGEFMLGHQ
jgi:SagB-type dehydrogenase family enzyme